MTLEKHIRAQATEMLQHPTPGVWGSAESYELQLLLLTSLEWSDVWGADSYTTVSVLWLRYLRPRFATGLRPLSALTKDLSELARELAGFRLWLHELPACPACGAPFTSGARLSATRSPIVDPETQEVLGHVWNPPNLCSACLVGEARSIKEALR